MAASTPNTISLKGDPLRKERDAGGTIIPGHLLQLDADNDVTVHAAAGGNATRWVALENDIAGDGIDVSYASGEVTQIASCKPGDEMFMWLADGETAVIGSYLESAASGDLKVVDADADSAGIDNTQSVVAMALQAVDRSASAITTHGRIKVEIV